MQDSRLSELARMIEAWPRLVDDSLVLLDHLRDVRTIVDVGSGGGLPGLAVKIARPDLDVTLVEADQARAAFLVQAAARLGVQVGVVAVRAEEASHDVRYREAFDVAVARALAPMPVLAELCLPFVAVGGRLLAQKTDSEKAEVSAASRAIAALGGRLQAVVPAPSAARQHGVIVVVDKLAPTPDAYPRRPGVPSRKPL